MNLIMTLVFAVVLTTWATITVAELGRRDRLDGEPPGQEEEEPGIPPVEAQPAEEFTALVDDVFDDPGPVGRVIRPARRYPDEPQSVHTVRDSQADTFDDEEDQR